MDKEVQDILNNYYDRVNELISDNLSDISDLRYLTSQDIQALKKEPEIRSDTPKIGSIYYAIDISGTIVRLIWHQDETDLKIWKSGNGFFTISEAESEVKYREVKTEMKAFSKEFDPNEDNWNFFWYDTEKEIYTNLFSDLKDTGLYFESEEKIYEMLNAVGEERVKKYYLGVK